MKKVLILLFSLISFAGFAQQLDSVKHIEIISEIRDSMALINKSDIDMINKAFHELKHADSLNAINDSIIRLMNIQSYYLDSALKHQAIVIKNDSLIKQQLKIDKEVIINKYERALKKEKTKKVFWQSTTGISILSILLILIL